ncbi:unnamed protein product [Rotaria sp. Silwood2]|nr:unnamed protein product [Rotaria sp. Silwood2]CAF4241189.1 unnamed protein product [Rotaria sp. Silwood2]CAF4387318.1 unnamed protein product [Rotaria sp. Silwood2]CAF4511884.1 unnamed protein product [Rotaria sp. Silwood2]
MFCYAVFIAVTLFAIGSNGKATKSVTDEPKRCCVPKQFSSVMSTSSGVVLPDGKTLGTYGTYNFSYDSDRGMVGMQGVSFSAFDQQKSNLWIIENMKDGKIYTYDLDSKQCYKSTMPIQPLTCIPDTATYIRSVTYGYGNKQIIGDTWLVKIDQAITYSTVSRDGLCVPLTGNSFLQNPAVATAITTTDFVPKIIDPAIFNIPDACKNIV